MVLCLLVFVAAFGPGLVIDSSHGAETAKGKPPKGMVLIPGGTNEGTNPLAKGEFYTDGYPEKYSLKVSSFYMDRCEVAKAKWDDVASWAKDHGYDIGPSSASGKAADHPVFMVTWYECVKWCNARSEKAGLRPAYYTKPSKKIVYKTGELNIEDNCVDWGGGYRLPTSDEWEYAARGGVSGKRFPWGTDTISHARANYCAYIKPEYDQSGGKRYHPDYMTKRASPFTSPVGAFEAGKNAYGLYDVAGNLQEWCWSWHPKWPGSHRVLRGSSWDFHTANCRVGFSLSYLPSSSYYYAGFRTCLPGSKTTDVKAEDPPESKPASPGKLTIALVDAEGKSLKESTSGKLELDRKYVKGDRIVVSGAENMAVRVDSRMLEALVHSPKKKVTYPIPLWAQGAYGNNPTKYTAYPRRPKPQAFQGAKHVITARIPTEKEVYSYRNVACNPMDKRDWRDPKKDAGGRDWPARIADDMYPHAVSNSEWRHSCIYAARNAIDGHVDSTGNHHGWPRQNWGPYANAGGEAHPNSTLRVDFGRPVEIDKLAVVVRYNPYQNNHFKEITVEFSDGSKVKINPKYNGERQAFGIKKRTVKWMKFTKLIDKRPGGYAALTEVEAWGKPAAAEPAATPSPAKRSDTSASGGQKAWRRGPPGHPAACGRRCGCTALGISPKEHRVKTNQREEIVADWRAQDGMIEGLDVNAIRRVVDGLKHAAGKLRADCDSLAKAKIPAKDPRWAALYSAACEKRRELRLKPYREALRRVVFTKHYELGGTHYAYTEGLSDAQHEVHFVPGSSLCLLEMDGPYARFRTLIDDPAGVIRDPDVSHDARRIVFAWKKSFLKDDYHLYEMDLKTEKVRQITSGLGYADYEPAYMPDGSFVFSSTRCIQSVDCWWTEVSNLFACDGDGRYIRRLGFDQVHTNYPTLTEDGRVIYTRWDYNDRGQMAIQSLFQMNPDGTNQRELYGNNSCFPTTILHTRSIPGTGKYVCILSGHHSRQRGWLAVIDPRKGRQENQGVQLVAPVRETLAKTEDAACQKGNQFKHPYPLSETAFLVGFATPPPGKNLVRSGTRPYGIYFMTVDGGRELLYKDNNISCTQPIPIQPRSVPKRASSVDYRKKTGTVYLHDVYVGPGLKGVKRGTIKRLRVVALEFRPCGAKALGPGGRGDKKTLALGHKNRGPISGGLISTPISIAGGTWDVKKVLGTAKVYDDGSACFTVQARTAIFFQALDAKGQMVQSMRSWMTLQPGEAVSCVGCHERKNQAPPVPYFSKALAAGAQGLDRTPFEGPPQGFSFPREIQPILDRHCLRCHHGDKDRPETKDHKPSFSLKWPASYFALADRKVCNWINAQSKPPMLPPYYTGAAQSKLIKILEGGKHTIFSPAGFGKTERTATTVEGPRHYNTKLSAAEMERLIVWIDVGVPCFGDYPIPQDNYFRKKRRRWEAQEAENIRQYLAAGEARGKKPPSQPSAAEALLKTLDPFYKQHVVAGGLLIVSSEKVSKHAVGEVAYLVRNMLANRPDVLQKLVERKMYVGVMAYNEMTTDIPEQSRLGPWWDMRARGLCGSLVTCAEENVLSFKGDPWEGENIFIHEFAHAIHHALIAMDRRFSTRIRALHDKALKTGRFRGYGMSDPPKQEPLEFWAEGVQAYFNCNGTIRPKGGGGQSSLEVLGPDEKHLCHIRTREQLKKYLPGLAKLIDDAFGKNPWTYVPVLKRLDQPHLRGHDPARAPTFRWPKKVIEAFDRIEAEKARKAKEAEEAENIRQRLARPGVPSKRRQNQ